MTGVRRAGVPALAKINLDLRVIHKRPDSFHELRTVFQTISPADRLDIAFTPGRRTGITLDDPLAIPNNLVVRAAGMVIAASNAKGAVEIRLTKRIPMGAGLGGGSSDAAAVLLALPVLTGRAIALPALIEMAEELGSDVPFFLLGGTAAGIGRGTELFPLADFRGFHGVLATPGIHVNTAKAFHDLSPRLTTDLQRNKILSFQSLTWVTGGLSQLRNDFEDVVFEQHPALAGLKRRLKRAGSAVAMMTGSGSAVYGLFEDRTLARRAVESLGEVGAIQFSLVTRSRYRSIWMRALAGHVEPSTWPLQSRYSR